LEERFGASLAEERGLVGAYPDHHTAQVPYQASAIRRLAIGGFISKIGTEAAFIALAVVVYERTGSGLWLAAVFLMTFGIPGLATPAAGVIADRFDRRSVMIASDLASALAFTALIFTQDRIAMILVAFVGAVVELPFGVGLSAAIPNLVVDEHLARANSTLSLGRKLGTVIGPALGGLLVATFGSSVVFALNALSFLVSSGLVLSVRAPFSKGRGDVLDSEYTGAGAGLRFIRAHPRLLAVLIAWTIMFLAVDITLVAQLPLSEAVGAGAIGFGLIGGAWGVGQVIGAFLGRWVTRRTEGLALELEMSTAAISLGAVAAIPTLPVAIAAEGTTGVFDQIGTIAGNTMIQRETPDAVRGRVFAAYGALGLLANSVAFIAGGFVVEAAGVRGVYAVAAGASVVATAVIIRAVRKERAEARA
jgi:MFS family permease